MKSGLYFTKTSNVLFNKNQNAKILTDGFVKVSQGGSIYIEDTNISQAVKSRFARIRYVKELATKFDTFVHFNKVPKD